MNIDKAIDELETDLRMNLYEPGSKLERAMKLGVEALKRVKGQRATRGTVTRCFLPGETEQ